MEQKKKSAPFPLKYKNISNNHYPVTLLLMFWYKVFYPRNLRKIQEIKREFQNYASLFVWVPTKLEICYFRASDTLPELHWGSPDTKVWETLFQVRTSNRHHRKMPRSFVWEQLQLAICNNKYESSLPASGPCTTACSITKHCRHIQVNRHYAAFCLVWTCTHGEAA